MWEFSTTTRATFLCVLSQIKLRNVIRETFCDGALSTSAPVGLNLLRNVIRETFYDGTLSTSAPVGFNPNQVLMVLWKKTSSSGSLGVILQHFQVVYAPSWKYCKMTPDEPELEVFCYHQSDFSLWAQSSHQRKNVNTACYPPKWVFLMFCNLGSPEKQLERLFGPTLNGPLITLCSSG